LVTVVFQHMTAELDEKAENEAVFPGNRSTFKFVFIL